MRRHRSYFPRDEAPLLDADGAFAGVDMVTAPDKLPAGVVAFARNMVFDDGECRVRPGSASMKWSNPIGARFGEDGVMLFSPVRGPWSSEVPYVEGDEVRTEGNEVSLYWQALEDIEAGVEPGTDARWSAIGLEDTLFFNDFIDREIFGAGRFSDPNGKEWMVLLLEHEALFCAQWQFPLHVKFPHNVALSGECTLTQAYDHLFLWRGEEAEPLVYTRESGWELLSVASPDPGDDTAPLPNAKRAVYFQNRLWVPFGRDSIAVGDLLSKRWDPAFGEEAINRGSADSIGMLYPYDRTTLLCFKHRSVYALSGVSGDLSGMGLGVISSEVGALAPDSVAGWGAFVAFLGEGGVWTLEQVEESRMQVRDKALSYPIQPLIDGINYQAVHRSQSIVFDGRLYVAAPMGSAAWPDTVLVYNINRGVWEGHWTSDDWKVRRWVKGEYFGEIRLFFWHEDGYLVLMGEGDEDEIGPAVAEISSEVVTRGYNAQSPERLQAQRLLINVRAARSVYSASVNTESVSRSRALVTSREPRRTKRRRIGQSRFDVSNINDDFDEPGREDYSVLIPGAAGLLHLQEGIRLDLLQEWEEVFPLERPGRYTQAKLESARGQFVLQAARVEARTGRRDSLRKGF